MNPTVDGMMAAMGWYRDADRTAQEMADLLARGETTIAWRDLSDEPEGMPWTWTDGGWTITTTRRADRLAPRWRVPAIRRRQAARRRAA